METEAITLEGTLTGTDSEGRQYALDATAVLHLPAEEPEPPTEEPVAPMADFDWKADYLSVQFMDTSLHGSAPLARHQWDFGDGKISEEEHPLHTYEEAGTYEVTLIVTGEDGRSDSTSQRITVEAEPEPEVPPTALFDWEADFLNVQFTFAGAEGSSPIVKREWDFDDGASSSESDPLHTYEEAGTYEVTLTVTDENGLSDKDVAAVTVEPEPIPPYADFGWETDPDDPLSVLFYFSGEIGSSQSLSYRWDFGDGIIGHEETARHTYGEGGTYEATLEVTGEDGTDTATQTVTVEAPPIPIEEREIIVAFEHEQIIPQAGDTITLYLEEAGADGWEPFTEPDFRVTYWHAAEIDGRRMSGRARLMRGTQIYSRGRNPQKNYEDGYALSLRLDAGTYRITARLSRRGSAYYSEEETLEVEG